MNRTYAVFAFILTCCAVSGCSHTTTEQKPLGSIHGKILLRLDSLAVAGVNVRLLDTSVPVDTVTYDNARVFRDSCFTDSTGAYAFKNVPAGTYYVLPAFDPRLRYRPEGGDTLRPIMLPAGGSDSLDFIADLNMQSPGSYTLTFEFHGVRSFSTHSIYADCYRRHWALFVPYLDFEVEEDASPSSITDTVFTVTFILQPAYTALLFSLDNTLDINFYYMLEPRGSRFFARYTLDLPFSLPSKKVRVIRDQNNAVTIRYE